MASYPSRIIAERSARLRQLGLGYANLGALLCDWDSRTISRLRENTLPFSQPSSLVKPTPQARKWRVS